MDFCLWFDVPKLEVWAKGYKDFVHIGGRVENEVYRLSYGKRGLVSSLLVDLENRVFWFKNKKLAENE